MSNQQTLKNIGLWHSSLYQLPSLSGPANLSHLIFHLWKVPQRSSIHTTAFVGCTDHEKQTFTYIYHLPKSLTIQKAEVMWNRDFTKPSPFQSSNHCFFETCLTSTAGPKRALVVSGQLRLTGSGQQLESNTAPRQPATCKVLDKIFTLLMSCLPRVTKCI